MHPTVTVRGVALGAGRPKIAVPLIARTRGELLAQAAELTALPADLAEWRADFYDALADEAALTETL
ncbi:MAG: type I 3-dehydroquinate dehydratase, partial [Oscillospiraceae bacterium]|nr:type I 3-dehydroquinate dehydratase [Oscillospiraceae bacterium]